MTNLKAVNIGQNKYCGPAVLSILTGKSTDECASVISRVNGQYTITGVYLQDLLKAAERLGFDAKKIEPQGSLFRTLTYLAVHEDGMFIVAIPMHFVCVEVKDKKIYFCDNHTKEPIPASSSARLHQSVQQIYKVIPKPDFKPEPEKPKVTPYYLFRVTYTPVDRTFPIQSCELLIKAVNRIEANRIALENNYKFFNQDCVTQVEIVMSGYKQDL